jgi:Uma2 family endonuclease
MFYVPAIPGGTMTTMITLPHSRPLTAADLNAAAEDGRQYELIDGSLILLPVGGTAHQAALGRLLCLLHAGCPPDLEVLPGPLDVVLSADTVLRPDLVVAPRADLTEWGLPKAPVLAVEVVSPSTKRLDLTLKFSRLEAAGCPSYWVIDPDTPELIAWELRDGAYAQVAKATGDEVARLTAPFEVSVVPADLTL